MSRRRDIDELLHHMPAVARDADNTWAANFARSILGQAKRPGWTPSPKQEALMQGLVSELFTHTDDIMEVQLIEE